jgi:hypothetical protein
VTSAGSSGTTTLGGLGAIQGRIFRAGQGLQNASCLKDKVGSGLSGDHSPCRN